MPAFWHVLAFLTSTEIVVGNRANNAALHYSAVTFGLLHNSNDVYMSELRILDEAA